MQSQKLRDRGFTMVELLITLTIFAAVLGSMVSFFVGQARSSRLADTRIEAVQRARFASEMLRREIGLAGSGIPNAQPMVVYAGPSDIVFSSDLASNVSGDRIAVYYLPDAPLNETQGPDSASMTLPNSQVFPLVWYGESGMPGPAEVIRFSFVDEGGSRYALVRAVNGLEPDTLLRGLMKVTGQDFFTYEAMEPATGLRDVGSGPIYHSAAVHGSPADTGASALADSVKLLHANFKIAVRGRQPNEEVEHRFTMSISLKNAGLIQNASCGDRPILDSTPVALPVAGPPRVQLSWDPAYDERNGEEDVFQYTLYRRKTSETLAKPIASIPPDAGVTQYTYMDTDVEPSETYVYLLGATDCTPTQSDLETSLPVLTPAL